MGELEPIGKISWMLRTRTVYGVHLSHNYRQSIFTSFRNLAASSFKFQQLLNFNLKKSVSVGCRKRSDRESNAETYSPNTAV